MATSKPRMNENQLRLKVKTHIMRIPPQYRDYLEFTYASHLVEGLAESFFDPKNPGPLKATNERIVLLRMELMAGLPSHVRENVIKTTIFISQYTNMFFYGEKINWCAGVVFQWLGRIAIKDYIRFDEDGLFVDVLRELLHAMDLSNNHPHNVSYKDWSGLERRLQEFDLFRLDLLDERIPETADIRDIINLKKDARL